MEKWKKLLNDAVDYVRPYWRRTKRRLRPVLQYLRGTFTWKKVLAVLFFLFFFSALGILWLIRDLPTPETFAQRTVAESTILYDRTGETILYDIHGDEKRRIVPLAEISPYMIDATIVTEDDQFYSHFGIDPAGILRSIFINIREGELAQGGSTITQQFVRNAVLTLDKRFDRKIREAVLSIAIELKFSKEDILLGYLNQISYGSLVYGVEAASQTYFGKPASDLTLAEAATLAAIPKATSYYSPHGDNRDELFARKDFIVRRMYELGYISAEERDEAIAAVPEIVPIKDAITAPHFVFYVQEELERRFGKERVEQGGLRVVTTLDTRLQEIGEKAIADHADRNLERYDAENAALVSLDPKTGEVLAMVGSKDYFSEEIDGNVNVTLRPRQPGSSFKPVVYAAGFEEGYTPDTILFDVETNFGVQGAKEYIPQNYNGRFHGPLTARQALANSLNVPAVKMLYLVGVRDAISFAERLGITTLTDPDRYGLALVLGGGEITLFEEAAAFGVFAADGKKAGPEVILKVEEADGNVLYEYEPEPEQVIDREVARQITDVMSDNAARSIAFGTRTPLVLPGRPAAAKTGTTQFYNDAWTVGFTPSLVAGVWVGNNDNSSMRPGAAGSTLAAPIWNQFMTEALADTEAEAFPRPKPVETGKPILDGEFAAPMIIKIDRASGKLATEHTPETWIEERAYGTIHDTLFWVDRNNPRGDAPEDPYQDPQFAAWEDAVQKWASLHEGIEVSTEPPPTEYDDIHVPENEPSLRVFAPSRNTTVSDSFTIVVSAEAPLDIQTVSYTFGDLAVGSLSPESGTSNFYSREVFLSPIPDGEPTIMTTKDLIVRAFDPFGNVAVETIPLRVREAMSDGNDDGGGDDEVTSDDSSDE